jgi:hypothetical protein
MENKNVMLNYDYLEKCDLAIQITNDGFEWYKIIKNRESATKISDGVKHISKAVFPVIFESDVKVVLFNGKRQLKGSNFIINRHYNGAD